jgi:hypothetical protein
MSNARLLVRALRDPASIGDCDWAGLVSAARVEQLIGSLAFRMEGRPVPSRIAAIFEDARRDAAHARTQALWEAEMARRALASLNVPMILMKGTAFHAADFEASIGRSVGDLDIMVPRSSLDAVEAALLEAGWEHVKDEEGYDDSYYRRWMHELPPLIHRERDRMIDVHHTILPLTARPKPDPEALVSASVDAGAGFRVLHPADMIVHAAAHLIADGDLAGGLRNLWDIDRLVRQFSEQGDEFTVELRKRAREHDLVPAVARALRLARHLYGTPVDDRLAGEAPSSDRLFLRRLLARDGWGRQRRPATRLGFYVRSHWLRMPPLMLARHLWVKARRR